ncbi:hypothetical protein [Nannocystis pusilla]|uniref:hypothetical protein n=1 Tax=Nannocystis pusilla TaxID=889268 RepID=UPI003B78B63C
MAIAWERPEHLRAEHTLAAASEPEIAGVVARVTARRLEFLVQAYRELGEPPARAAVGRHRDGDLPRHGPAAARRPEVAPTDAAFRALVRHFTATLLPASSR